TRQHAQQWHLGQGHGRRAIVDQQDLVAGQCQFVATASAGAVQGGYELQAAVATGVFDAITRFVGELAEVDLPGVRGQAQHENIAAGTENPIFQTRDDNTAHLRVLEAYALQRVVQFYVDTEVVGIELELVAGTDALVFGDVHGEGGDGAVHG